VSDPTITMDYPLRWPVGRPRTPASGRKWALWKEDGRRLTLTIGRRRLREQVNMMTRRGQAWRVTNQVLSTNIRFTLAGTRDQSVSRRDPDDVGVAFYFKLDGRPHVLACDLWDTVQDNIAAIAAHIEALRGQERWGVADLVQAFAGHVALPAPEQWWEVLGVDRHADAAAIDAAWRAKMRVAHPDRGGSDAAAARLNWARDEGKRAGDSAS
jgi:DnaJ-domain-containing protein 1